MGFMRHLPRVLRRAGVSLRGIIHVGAHAGQEADKYAPFGTQLWVEPQPEVYARLLQRVTGRPGVFTANVACGEQAGEATMHILANNDGQSNSLLEPAQHLEEHPEYPLAGTMTVRVARLDDVLTAQGLRPEQFSVLVLDVQGYELHVLRGAPNVLAAAQAVVAEVSTAEVYRSCARLGDIDQFMAAQGFIRTRLRLRKRYSYGDALYIRQNVLAGWERLRYRLVGSRA